jgi:hypothetical protein
VFLAINVIKVYAIAVPKFDFNKNLYIYPMGRNNEKNIKAHNDKLHKAQDKAKAKKVAREELRKAILKKYNDSKTEK